METKQERKERFRALPIEIHYVFALLQDVPVQGFVGNFKSPEWKVAYFRFGNKIVLFDRVRNILLTRETIDCTGFTTGEVYDLIMDYLDYKEEVIMIVNLIESNISLKRGNELKLVSINSFVEKISELYEIDINFSYIQNEQYLYMFTKDIEITVPLHEIFEKLM